MNQSQQTSCHFKNMSIADTLNLLGNRVFCFCFPVLIIHKQKLLAFLYQIMDKAEVLIKTIHAEEEGCHEPVDYR